MSTVSRAAALLLSFGALAAVLYSSGDIRRQSLRAGRRLQAFATQTGASAGQFAGQAGAQAYQDAQQGAQTGGNVGSQFMEHGSNLANHGWQYGANAANRAETYGNLLGSASNPATFLPKEFRYLSFPFYVLQIIFAVVYGCTVVSNYPYWQGPNPMSAELQAQPAPCATVQTSPANCCLSWCCPQARAAHTFDKTGTLEYWCGVLAMFLCPFCTLCFTNACTDLNPKLGGQDQNPIMSALCTWLCFCCTIAQDAESLDLATGAQTTPCGVQMAYPPQMGPPQMMMGPGYY